MGREVADGGAVLKLWCSREEAGGWGRLTQLVDPCSNAATDNPFDPFSFASTSFSILGSAAMYACSDGATSILICRT